MAFLSMEENKGRDKYDINRHNMFKVSGEFYTLYTCTIYNTSLFKQSITGSNQVYTCPQSLLQHPRIFRTVSKCSSWSLVNLIYSIGASFCWLLA